MILSSIPEYIDKLPNICGYEESIAKIMSQTGPIYLSNSGIDFDNISSAFAIALHMHQPLIPAGGDNLKTAEIISNLKDMMDHPEIGDNHNAPTFHWCYQRIGRFVPQLVHEGRQPRVMLDYSGCLLHGLIQMGLDDVIEDLRNITCQTAYHPNVEWLGSPWGHSVAPSTPMQDYRLHVRAWQHFFAAVFGFEALGRVRGFAPSEMALPNHPDVCYEFVKILKECGYRWLLLQEHTVESVENGGPIQEPHIPHQLVAKNSKQQTITITAIIKTQGSDTKLVGQMQPYYEAKNLSRKKLAGKLIPQLVTQIADGENGGVMMNEFPSKYLDVMAEASGTKTPALNITEYLEYLESLGIREEDFPAVQPVMQKSVWEKLPKGAGPEVLEKVIKELEKQEPRFHMEGGSWTNNISWVRGYDHVLGPMEQASALFAEKVLAGGVSASQTRYRNALYHLLMTQTSCFRYWGQGLWTDYGRELCRRTIEILKNDF
jgi:hypothetical protein